MRYRPEYFTPAEFECPCCHRAIVTPMLIYQLEMLRRSWTRNIDILKGYRCERCDTSASVTAYKSSSHRDGRAADITPTDRTLQIPFQYLIGQMFGRIPGYELRFHETFTHIAVPAGDPAGLWTGGIINVEVRSYYKLGK